MENFFATCPRGLEAALAAELAALAAQHVKAVDGGVQFAGPFELCYSVNLESRLASRVLWKISRAPYRSEQDIYETTHALPWCDWFGPERSIRVNVAAIKSP